jgi:hypothetical protein
VGPSTPQARHDGGTRAPAIREPGRKREPDRKDTTPAKSDASRAQPAKATDDESASGGREFVNAPSSRTNIALPFSKIEVQEPSAELSELAGLLCELIETFEQTIPKAQRKQLSDLHARAQALRARMR